MQLRDNLKRTGSVRSATMILGAWLVVSAFAFPQSLDQAMVMGIAGLLIAISAGASVVADGARYVDTMVALLLLVAVAVVPSGSVFSQMNEACVAVAVLVLSILSGPPGRVAEFFDRHRHHPHV